MLGQYYTEFIKFQNGLSRDLFHCHDISEAIQCLSAPRQLDPNESCGPLYQMGACFPEAALNTQNEFSCSFDDDYGADISYTKINCDAKGWSSVEDALKDCNYGDESVDYDSNMSYDISYQDYSSSSFANYTDTNDSAIYPMSPEMSTSIKYMGYTMTLATISLIFCLISFILMSILLRKCTRIYIHMNLLAAFMLRHTTFIAFYLFKSIQWKVKVEPRLGEVEKNLIDLNNNTYGGWNRYVLALGDSDLPELKGVSDGTCAALSEFEVCRCQLQCLLYPVFQKYSVLVCFSWLACEGIYLVMLHLKPLLLIQRFNPMRWFLGLSWGLPLIPVGLWAALAYHNCVDGYATDQEDNYERIIEIPIYIYIIICAVVFVVIIYGIFQKLNAPHHGSGRSRVFGVLKAAVSLIPLLGMQHVALPFATALDDEVIRKMYPVFLVLSQCSGIIVSILYCFLSAEIREAIERRWKQHQELRDIYNEISTRRQSRDSSSESSKISQLFSRFRRRSEASTFSILRQPSSEPNVHRVEEDASEGDPVIPLFDPCYKRPSTCSKHSDFSNGYYSGLSDNSESAVNTITDTKFVVIAKRKINMFT